MYPPLIIVEICEVSDKRASYYVEVNTKMGYEVFQFNKKYYTAWFSERVSRN